MSRQRIIVAIAGASGHPYEIRLLETLVGWISRPHLLMSESAVLALAHESDMKLKDVHALADHVHANDDVAAPYQAS